MMPTKTTAAALAFAALAITLTGCSPSGEVEKPDGFVIHSGDLNSSPEELAPWRHPGGTLAEEIESSTPAPANEES